MSPPNSFIFQDCFGYSEMPQSSLLAEIQLFFSPLNTQIIARLQLVFQVLEILILTTFFSLLSTFMEEGIFGGPYFASSVLLSNSQIFGSRSDLSKVFKVHIFQNVKLKFIAVKGLLHRSRKFLTYRNINISALPQSPSYPNP